MSQEDGRYFGNENLGVKPDPSTFTLPERIALAVEYEELIARILEEVKVDSYWITPQELEDGEVGLPPISVLSALDRIVSKLRGDIKDSNGIENLGSRGLDLI